MHNKTIHQANSQIDMSFRPGFRRALLGVFVLCPLLAGPLYGQDAGGITLDLQLNELVNEAQVLSLSTLGVDRRGEGQQLGTLLLQNRTNEPQSDLYFYVRVENTARVIAELDQEQGRPFSLAPGQVVRASNNSLQQGLPGIETTPKFSGGLTSAGEDFVNDLEGQARLPNDQFTLTLAIYQGGNRLSGGEWVASASATVGTNAVSNVRDVYINRPGAEVGSGLDIAVNTPRPTFNWAGETGVDYRLVVVQRDNQDSPETLIEGAEDTAPILVNNSSRNNTLLQYEMADVRVSGNTFQYPASSVKSLQPGQTYLWRVSALVKTAEGEDVVASEIWQFSLATSQTGPSSELSAEMTRTLRSLIGPDRLPGLQGENLTPQSIVIDGTEYSGAAMRQRLQQFLNRARRGDITIINE